MGIHSGTISKINYQKKIKPLIKYYGFINTSNYTHFKLDDYRITFDDSDKNNYSRRYYFFKIVKENSGRLTYYSGWNVDEFVKSIKDNLIHIKRKNIISDILNG